MTMIDDVLNGIGKEFEKVQSKSQEIMQSYNLATQVKELERKRTAKLLELGRLVCDKYLRSADVTEDVLKDKANEVAGYEHEISIMQSEIDTMKTATDPNTPASAKADAKAGYSHSPGFECPKCHAPANRDKAFCPLCGSALKGSNGDGGDDIVDVEPSSGS
jgi:DNA-directed RNA polymerase subunit M/transcription elongation factor TFIIS